MTTVTYNEVMNPIMYGMFGVWGKQENFRIKDYKFIKFSQRATTNLDLLDRKIQLAKQFLPLGYIKNFRGGSWWDNQPNEDSSVWFIRIFVKAHDEGKYIPYVAYKVTFEGTDAMKARIDPKVLHVEFITERARLTELVNRLIRLPKAGQK